ncbi:MAG: hypothetical protein MUE49_05760 [Rhodospirillales bacterium]|nr:hypothetical protein [Rhodospirillales bacterium]
MQKPCVFIHTNDKQIVGAIVARHALQRNSRHADAFDVRFLQTADYPFLAAREGQRFKRDGIERVWTLDDLQSFTPLRFMPPQVMGYEGRAIVIDPDVFAIGDVWELFSRDMQGRAIACRRRNGAKGLAGYYASSVMLLDCAKLTHWQCERQFNELFDGERDYMDWISLKLEPPGSIAALENEWNDFDRLTPQTKMLHNTRRLTQPWKTGLPIDWMPPDAFKPFPPFAWAMRYGRRLFGKGRLIGRYWRHPDRKQEALFFGLLRECLDSGVISETMLRAEMARDHVRHDAFEVLDRTAPLPQPLAA